MRHTNAADLASGSLAVPCLPVDSTAALSLENGFSRGQPIPHDLLIALTKKAIRDGCLMGSLRRAQTPPSAPFVPSIQLLLPVGVAKHYSWVIKQPSAQAFMALPLSPEIVLPGQVSIAATTPFRASLGVAAAGAGLADKELGGEIEASLRAVRLLKSLSMPGRILSRSKAEVARAANNRAKALPTSVDAVVTQAVKRPDTPRESAVAQVSMNSSQGPVVVEGTTVMRCLSRDADVLALSVLAGSSLSVLDAPSSLVPVAEPAVVTVGAKPAAPWFMPSAVPASQDITAPRNVREAAGQSAARLGVGDPAIVPPVAALQAKKSDAEVDLGPQLSIAQAQAERPLLVALSASDSKAIREFTRAKSSQVSLAHNVELPSSTEASATPVLIAAVVVVQIPAVSPSQLRTQLAASPLPRVAAASGVQLVIDEAVVRDRPPSYFLRACSRFFCCSMQSRAISPLVVIEVMKPIRLKK